MTHRFRWFALAMIAGTAACRDDVVPSAPAFATVSLVVVGGEGQAARANTILPAPVQVAVHDSVGNPRPNQAVTFTVVDGGGSLQVPNALGGTTASASATVQTDANGVATAAPWLLGKSALPQTLRATNGAEAVDAHAIVQSSYNITVRFWGAGMDASQQALFTNAAARLIGIVIGDVADVNAQNVDLNASCGVTGQPALSETIDDVIIYASIQAIDGPGKILAQSGPCLFRNTPGGVMPAVGVMEFDSADLNTLAGQGSLQDVIIHEMLHVLGIGVLWEDRGLVTGIGTSNPRYTGPNARQGCIAVGGSVTCASSVPVESTGGEGTAGAHWRESTFDHELMTGFLDSGVNPLSQMTIGGLADLGYTVNTSDFDSYTIPGGLLRSGDSPAMPAQQAAWEHVRVQKWVLDAAGHARPFR